MAEMMAWFNSNLLGTKLVVPTNLYQRDKSKGWTKIQQQEYVRTVMEGQASTPFVVNIKRGTARVMDGAHRLEALDLFKKNKIGIPSCGVVIYHNQVVPRN